MSVYLHIGAPKCGSTTLQALISENRESLKASGLATSAKQIDAHRIAHRFTRGWLEGIEGPVTPEEHTLLSSDRGGDLLLSSEAFMVMAGKPAQLEGFLSNLTAGEPLHILSVVRRPSSQLESTWLQWMRTYRTFPKIKEEMNRRGFDVDKTINDGKWLTALSENWTTWTTHPRVAKSTTLHMELGAPIDFVKVLEDMTERPLSLAEPETAQNVSMNGVTFRLLREFTETELPHYNRFLNRLERMTRRAGFGKYRILNGAERAKVDQAMAYLPLFEPYADPAETRPSAYDLDEKVWADLLKEARRLARNQTRVPSKQKNQV